jgi:hypothetical protein
MVYRWTPEAPDLVHNDGTLADAAAGPAWPFEHFAMELGEPAHADTPPANPAVPGPEVLGPVAERYGIEVVGPPQRAR